jgi:lysozyme
MIRRFATAVVLAGLSLVMTTGFGEARNPYPKKGDAEPHHGVAAARRHAVQGIDVSKWQREIDWDKVKSAGTRFAFIKATEGGDLLDERFRENWAESKRAGVPRGAYHFMFWCRPARDQVRWFIRNVPNDPEALPPVVDAEWNNESSCPRTSPEKARAKLREILHALEIHYRKRPVIYTDINFHADVLEDTKEFEKYPFWIRSTAARPEARYEDRRWEFWQFTTTGRVPGIVGDVDRNSFFGTEKQFAEWRAGRFDIASRQPIKPGSKLALPAPAPEPAETTPARRVTQASETPAPRARAAASAPVTRRATSSLTPRLRPPRDIDTTSSIRSGYRDGGN